MDPIKRWYRSIPIWLALFLFVIAALLIASFFSNNTTAVINKLNMNIQAKYITVVEGHVPNGGDVTYIGGDIGEDVQYNFNYDQYSDKDRHLHKTYNFYFGVCAYILLFKFYHPCGVTILLYKVKETSYSADGSL